MRALLLCLFALGCKDHPQKGGTRFELALEGSATTQQLEHLVFAARERLDEKGAESVDVKRAGTRVIVQVPKLDAEIVNAMRAILQRSLTTELRWPERGETTPGRDVLDADFSYEGDTATPIVKVTLARPPTAATTVEIVADGKVRETARVRVTPDGIVLSLDGADAEIRAMHVESMLRQGSLPRIKLVTERAID